MYVYTHANTRIYRHIRVFICFTYKSFSPGRIIILCLQSNYRLIVGMTTEEDLKYSLSIIIENILCTLRTA